ncbi:MAG: hypothetical protein ABJK64_16075 [Paraglaciecola sp.]|uniref:hypothetical protein n=1 Tax=Paraglaciecola sp. TaxID=1920173 RepID=UPI00329698B8
MESTSYVTYCQCWIAINGLSGQKVSNEYHLDIKMVAFYEGHLKQGRQLFITNCNPATVRDEMVEYLVSLGAEASAWKNMSEADWQAFMERTQLSLLEKKS